MTSTRAPRPGRARFGVVVPNHGTLAEADLIRSFAISAEELGFDSIWVIDHILVPRSWRRVFGATAFEPLVVLSYLAAETRRVCLGTTVLVLPYRNAVVTAKMLATLDVMSGGRLIVGVGSGHIEAEFAALGVDYARRGPITDETLHVFRALWSGRPVRHPVVGERFRNVYFRPIPLQRPGPPVLIGGVGRRSIDRAVAYGDGWHPTTLLRDRELEAGVREFHRRWREAGRKGEPELALGVPVQWAEPGDSRPPRTWGGVRVVGGSADEIAADLGNLARFVTHFVLHVRARSREDIEAQLNTIATDVLPQVAVHTRGRAPRPAEEGMR